MLAATNQPAFFTEDNRLPVSMGAFSWPPMWMSQAPGTGGVLSGAALKSYLADFDQKAGQLAGLHQQRLSTLPDIYQRAGCGIIGATWATAMVTRCGDLEPRHDQLLGHCSSRHLE